MRARRRPPQDAPRVIVIGAGFAGLAAVAELHRAGAQVQLIDRNIYSTFQPLLYQVATGGLNPGDVAYPLRPLARKKTAKFRLGELAGIDPAGRRVTLGRRGPAERLDAIVVTHAERAGGQPGTVTADRARGHFGDRDGHI